MNAPDGPSPAAGSVPIDDNLVFRTLFSSYPDALVVVDGGGRVVLANPSAAALLGFAVDELVGMQVDELVPDAVRPRHAEFRAGFARHPRARPMGMQNDLVARRKDGTEVQVEIALSPLSDHGMPLVVAAIRDIGTYPRVRHALQRARCSEQLARIGRLAVEAADPQTLFDQVPRAVADVLEVEFVTVYLVASHLRELSVASAIGGLAGESTGDRLPNRPDTSIGFVLAEGRSVIVPDYASERRFAVPAAYLDAGLTSAIAVPLTDRGRPIGVLAVRSRTAREFGADEVAFLEALANLLTSHVQRAQSEEALGHAQRLESVGQLTGGIAHDFNNLLTVIQGNLQVLEESRALIGDEVARQLVDAAARASRRGAELTSKLLAFSRRQVLQPSTVDVGGLLGSLADLLRRTLDQHIRIELEVAAGCPLALADPGQLDSALLNIAINARDAMPGGGALQFRARAAASLPTHLPDDGDAPRAPSGGYVAIAIADTGTGMSEAVRDRAFEPFFTTKALGRGTGLGLSTVYGFARQSRGAVTIDSTLGEGTTITLFIPAVAADAAPAVALLPAITTALTALPDGLAVLLVEDDPEVCAVVQRFFESMGAVVTPAPSGERAMSALAEGASFDLLVSDIALGSGMRGTELAAHAQARLPALKVLLISGYSADLLDADRIAPPAWELLRKPFSREELARAAARVVGGAGEVA